MAKKVKSYKIMIERALKKAGKYSPGLNMQIMSLAGALRTLDMANDEIDELDSTVITETSRYGNITLGPHPVFKIQKDAQDSITRQLRVLGLTVDELSGTDENDPLIDLTQQVRDATKSAASKGGEI